MVKNRMVAAFAYQFLQIYPHSSLIFLPTLRRNLGGATNVIVQMPHLAQNNC